MASATSHSLHDFGQDTAPGEWQALRGELVALLDQVEGRFVRVPSADAGYDALADRMRALRHQVTEVSPKADRHQEALRSVQRAVQRFNDRGEPLPTNPQDILQSAIREIRGGARPTYTGQSPRAAVPRLDDFAQAVNGMTSRLEQLEGELRSQRSGAQSIREVAEQVAQLTHVVELLAGAVGETGQVKRLEGQIASLAQMIDQKADVDLSALTRRLDDVSATVERLADLQVEHFAMPQAPDGLATIETSLRAIYDRIDMIERNVALPSGEVDKLTDTMGQITEALRRGDPKTDRLLTLVDALHNRVGAMEERAPEMGGLAADVAGLRDAVSGAVEPRFAALEMQLEALGTRVDARQDGGTEIAAQIRQLIERMDETSAQITGLAAMYEAGSPAAEPDYGRLAEMVAARAAPGIDAKSLDALEERMTASMKTVMSEATDEFSGIRAGMRKVDERLANLEVMLTDRPSAEPAPARPAAKAKTVIADVEAIAPEAPAKPLLPHGKGDAMPMNPSDDMPLIDQGFSDPSPVRSALEAKVAQRSPRSEMAAAAMRAEPAKAMPVAAEPAMPAAPRPSFDPSAVERPPRPESSLAAPLGESFAPTPDVPKPESASVKTSTFVEAARRATQRQALEKPTSGSLIGRALSRFHENAAAKAAGSQAPAIAAAPEIKAEKPQRSPRGLLGRKPRAEAVETGPAMRLSPAADGITLGAEMEPVLPKPRESFLARHSKVILLGCSVVALALLAVNLYVQRSGGQADPGAVTAPAAPETAPAPVSDVPPTSGKVSSLSDDMLVLPDLDETTTSSIDNAALSFAAPTSVAAMPASLQTASLASTIIAPPVAAELSPVKVDLPPEAIGPDALRQAAANGDARAQFEIAAIYTEGRVVPEDLDAAAMWYERAAAQGFAPAQYRLANLYENGRGVAKDLEQARLWYQRAAEAGNRMSMHNLASLYASGNLGKQEFAKAAEWFEQAADRGMTDSQFNLGMLYARGLGVPQNLETSYKWFSLAADKGDKDAGKARDDVAASLDAETMARAKNAAAIWTAQQIDLAANFAPIGTWSDTFDPGQVLTNRDVVARVQAALVRLGYDIGTPDGLSGPKTEEAIRAFEHGTGMSETGQVNPRLLAVLGSQPV